MSMFIPPEGAMQFEFQATRSEALTPFVGCAFWVQDSAYPPADKLCACRPKWEVIVESVPPRMGDLIRLASAKSGRVFVVCKCNGRIIE